MFDYTNNSTFGFTTDFIDYNLVFIRFLVFMTLFSLFLYTITIVLRRVETLSYINS